MAMVTQMLKSILTITQLGINEVVTREQEGTKKLKEDVMIVEHTRAEEVDLEEEEGRKNTEEGAMINLKSDYPIQVHKVQVEEGIITQEDQREGLVGTLGNLNHLEELTVYPFPCLLTIGHHYLLTKHTSLNTNQITRNTKKPPLSILILF